MDKSGLKMPLITRVPKQGVKRRPLTHCLKGGIGKIGM